MMFAKKIGEGQEKKTFSDYGKRRWQMVSVGIMEYGRGFSGL